MNNIILKKFLSLFSIKIKQRPTVDQVQKAIMVAIGMAMEVVNHGFKAQETYMTILSQCVLDSEKRIADLEKKVEELETREKNRESRV